jgi:hypothetical protein
MSGNRWEPLRLSVQIFLSYARADDASPNLSDGKGFVTRLDERLYDEFRGLGAPWPTVWRDKRGIKPGDQFELIIEDAIAKADLLLVVLSHNWLNSHYCWRELESFRRRWQHEGELGVRQRIVIVGKHYVERKKRPALLQRQGYDFFASSGSDETRMQFDFCERSAIVDRRYEITVEALAGFLHRRANDRGAPGQPPRNRSFGAGLTHAIE